MFSTSESLVQLCSVKFFKKYDGSYKLLPCPTAVKNTRSLCYRYFVKDALTVCLQICTKNQRDTIDLDATSDAGEPMEIPCSGDKVRCDASPSQFLLSCSDCGQWLQSLPLRTQQLELPILISIKLDLVAFLRNPCCDSGAADRSVIYVADSEDECDDSLPKTRNFWFRVELELFKESHLQQAVICEALAQMHDDPHSDLTLRLGSKDIRAHRFVLSMFSPVFRAMLSHSSFAEAQLGVVEVKDVRVEVMEAALRYMYGMDVGDLDQSTQMDLLILADRYQLKDLKSRCERALCRDSSSGDILALLTFADVYSAPHLLETILDRVAAQPRWSGILNAPGAEEFIAAHPKLVLELWKRL